MSPRAAGLLAALALVLTAPVALAAPPTWQSRVASAARYADTRTGAYLRKADVRGRALQQWERDLLAPMIRRSDNAAASRMVGLVGETGLNRLARVAIGHDFAPVFKDCFGSGIVIRALPALCRGEQDAGMASAANVDRLPLRRAGRMHQQRGERRDAGGREYLADDML